MIRWHIRFYGRVQGVGFRYTARHAAAGLDLTGWVKNNEDGSVEMEVQGENHRISQMLDMISQNRWIYIEDMDVQEIPLEEERKFCVR